MRTVMVVLLILLSPLAFLMPFSNPSQPTYTRALVVERTATATYTSTAFDASVVSTTGTMMVQTPVSIPSQGVGFMAPKGKCSQFMMPLALKSGVTLNLKLASTNPVSLYLLSSEAYRTSANGCALVGSSLLAENNFTVYTLHWTATENSTLYLLLAGPSTIIILMNDGSSQAVQQLATTTYSSTATNLNVYSSAMIANYTTSTTVPTSTPLYYLPPQQTELSLIAFIAALLGSMFLLGSHKGFVKLERLKKILNGAR